MGPLYGRPNGPSLRKKPYGFPLGIKPQPPEPV